MHGAVSVGLNFFYGFHIPVKKQTQLDSVKMVMQDLCGAEQWEQVKFHGNMIDFLGLIGLCYISSFNFFPSSAALCKIAQVTFFQISNSTKMGKIDLSKIENDVVSFKSTHQD